MLSSMHILNAPGAAHSRHLRASAASFQGQRVAVSYSVQPARKVGRVRITTRAVGWDPEGILANPEGGHIDRRRYVKKLANDAAFLEQEEKRVLAEIAERDATRAARVLPAAGDHTAVTKFLLGLGTTEELDFEVVRIRPLLTAEYIAALETALKLEKLSARRDENKVAELDGLLSIVIKGVAKVDSDAQRLSAPADRLKRLLSSPKKETILEMAAENALDDALVALLDQNIDGAKASGQDKAAEFMLKIRGAITKFVISPSSEPKVVSDATAALLNPGAAGAEEGAGKVSQEAATVLLGMDPAAAAAAAARRRKANAA